MSGSPESFETDDQIRERVALESQRPLALTPVQELAHGDGRRWAALDVVDLDPPTTFPPY